MLTFGDYNASDLLWLGDWSPRWLAVLTVVGLAVLAFSAFDLRDLKPLRRWTLVGLRGVVFALAVMLLLEPAIDLRETSQVENHVAVVVDSSQTMALRTDDGDTTRMDRAQDAIEQFGPLEETLQGEHRFDYFTYGSDLETATRSSLAELEATAESADLTGAIHQLRDEYDDKDLAAVVIISDGIDTGAIGSRTARGEELDEQTRDLLESLDAPVHTLAAAGDSGVRDIAVSRVLHDDFAFVHNTMSIDVELQAIGMETKTVPVTLRRDGEAIHTKNIQIHPDESTYELDFEFVPEEIGKEVYTVEIPEYDNEALYRNNEHHFVLPVIRDRIRVLQVVGRPSWDQRFMRRLLKQNPNVELISFFILRTDENPQLVPQNEMSLIRFPTDELFRDELGSFDLVLFQNFNFGPYNMRRYLDNVADFVRDGGGFAMIGGDLSFASGGYAGTPIEELLPVELPSSTNRSEITDSGHFGPQLTETGDRHPITQLAFDPEENRQTWDELPDMRGTNVVDGPTDDAAVLAEHPTIRRGGEPMPVISVAERDEGRVMAVTSDSTWRWGFEHVGQGGTPRQYRNFWNSAIRWLIQDPELKLVRLETHRDIVAPGDELDTSVRVFESDYSPAADVDGQFHIRKSPLDNVAEGTDEASSHYDTIDFRTDHDGQWELDRRFDEPGIYEFDVEVPSDAGTLTDDNLILIAADVSQYRDIEPRHELLAMIADAADGVHTVLPDFDSSRLHFNAPRHQEVHNRNVVQLWDNLVLFVIILGLLGAEWTLRRRWGRL